MKTTILFSIREPTDSRNLFSLREILVVTTVSPTINSLSSGSVQREKQKCKLALQTKDHTRKHAYTRGRTYISVTTETLLSGQTLGTATVLVVLALSKAF